MKNWLLTIIALSVAQLTHSTELSMRTVMLPLYVPFATVNEGGEVLHLEPRGVQFLSRGAEPETTLTMLGSPFVPANNLTWDRLTDANLISRCKLKISHSYEKIGGKTKLVIIVSKANFIKPKDVTIAENEVLTLVKSAVSQNFPDSEIRVR